jgi:hypothetical protein
VEALLGTVWEVTAPQLVGDPAAVLLDVPYGTARVPPLPPWCGKDGVDLGPAGTGLPSMRVCARAVASSMCGKLFGCLVAKSDGS